MNRLSDPTLKLADGREFLAILAKIDSTMLGFEDHGLFTFVLDMEWRSSNQGFGTCILSGYDEGDKRQKGTAFGTDFIMQVLKTVGVSEWEQLKGKRVFVLKAVNDHYGRIEGIANVDDPERVLIVEDLRLQWYPK